MRAVHRRRLQLDDLAASNHPEHDLVRLALTGVLERLALPLIHGNAVDVRDDVAAEEHAIAAGTDDDAPFLEAFSAGSWANPSVAKNSSVRASRIIRIVRMSFLHLFNMGSNLCRFRAA